MMFLRAVILAAMIVAMPLAVRAAEPATHTIVLHHMELETIDGELRVGDTVVFENRSDMAHNLYITYADGTIDNLDTQFPGMQRKVALRVAGPAVVRCWIHPIIKAEIDILETPGSDVR